ncbi:MAG: DNA adenine methylase [Acidobacteria bacterium]|nr:DNA adenine methylase [Acidobacteriota bacterium]
MTEHVRNQLDGTSRPVLRWAGAKQGLAPTLKSLLPPTWGTYYEPMVGAGALFFCIRPRRAVLSDTNHDLVNFYRVLRDRFPQLKRRLQGLSASVDAYYTFRASSPRGLIQRAVRFAYLNRLSWNGLYRVNRLGTFNVPIGDRLPDRMWSMKHLESASEALMTARLRAEDFRIATARAREGDFVFFDPPYPRGATDGIGFNRYAPETFTPKDHEDLAILIRELTSRNVRVMVTIANAEHLRELYPATFRTILVRSKSLISCNGHSRRNVDELVLMNY